MQTVNSITVLLVCGVITVVLWNGQTAGISDKEGVRPEDAGAGKQEGQEWKRLFLLLAVYVLIAVRVIAIGEIPGE